MRQTKSVKLTGLLLALSALYFCFTYFMADYLYIKYFIVWNIFLCLVPLGFAWVVKVSFGGRLPKVLGIIGFVLWFLFFPNGPYILTDFIHLNRYRYYYPVVGYPIGFIDWTGLVHLVIGVSVGVLAGFLSLYLNHALVKKRWGSIAGVCFATVICLISGVAIYIGRFLRFNSWDAFYDPIGLINQCLHDMNGQTLGLSLLFAAMTGISYLLFCTCMGWEDD